MNDCIFCKIANKEIASQFLMEDENCVIFRDIHPKAPTHLLIVPKKHISSISEMKLGDEIVVGKMVDAARKIAEKLGIGGYNLQINVGKDGGQEIFHIHIHLMSKLTEK